MSVWWVGGQLASKYRLVYQVVIVSVGLCVLFGPPCKLNDDLTRIQDDIKTILFLPPRFDLSAVSRQAAFD